MFAPKNDGSLRFCVDDRKLNAVTVGDSYPLHRMDWCIDSPGEATIFSTLDANSGYWQIKIEKKEREKTAFKSDHELYQFFRMPFGLRNAPETLQRAIGVILSSVKWKTELVYLNDIVSFTRTVEDCIAYIAQVLTLLENAGLTLKMKKKFFLAEKIDRLGHFIRPGRLEVSDAITKSIQELQEPTMQKEVRSFLGFCNVFRRFVQNHSKISAPLNRKLRKNQP